MAAKVTVTIDRSRVAARIKAGTAAMIRTVSEQALSDCNYFAKRDQGTLIESSQTASDVENGQLVWDTPYARRQYYTGAPLAQVMQMPLSAGREPAVIVA